MPLLKVPSVTLLEANRLVAFGLVVLIWLVQVIVYPAFSEIPAARFATWHAGYTRAISGIVAPLMLGQAALLGWLLAVRPSPWAALAAGLVALAWVVTFALAVPAHEALQAAGPDPDVIARLIAVNGVRTVAWTLAFLALLLA
jgi:hypothetical protein